LVTTSLGLHAQSINDVRAPGNALFSKAEKSMQEAQSPGHTFGIIAQALAGLKDSHTFFMPPARVSRVQYGWKMRMIGDRCFVTGVKPGSDADTKKVQPGDEVLAIEGFRPTRDNLWRMKLMYYSLQPRPQLRVAIRKPSGQEGMLELAAAVKTGKQVIDLAGEHGGEEYYEMLREEMSESSLDPHALNTVGKEKELVVYRMPQFDLSAQQVDDTFGKLRGYQGVILDLRGNSGGSVQMLERAAAHLLGKDVLLAERKGRKQEKPIKSQGTGSNLVEGKLVVIVDSESGSASELLARAVQIEKRGTVIGDRTAGAVRQSRQYSEKIGFDRVVFFGVSVTNADLIMKDGKSIENVGVVPDKSVFPTPEDMAAGRDPVLAAAAELLGVTISPEAAGRMFPVKWRN
jgi:C-terminal processing protease CtpA/Prc